MLILRMALSTAVLGASIGEQARQNPSLSLFLSLFKSHYFVLHLRPLLRDLRQLWLLTLRVRDSDPEIGLQASAFNLPHYTPSTPEPTFPSIEKSSFIMCTLKIYHKRVSKSNSDIATHIQRANPAFVKNIICWCHQT